MQLPASEPKAKQVKENKATDIALVFSSLSGC